MIVVPASYSFPTADNTTPRYQDAVLGPTDLIRSRTGFFIDPNPIFGPGLPNTLLRQDDGQLIYGAYGTTLDDEPIVLVTAAQIWITNDVGQNITNDVGQPIQGDV